MRGPIRSLICSGLLLTASNSAAVSPGFLGPRVESPAVPQAQPLRVRLYDPYHLLSKDSTDWLQQEVVRAFDASDIGLRFVGSGGPGVIPATLYPELTEHWDVAPEAIGVAIGVHGERRSIFLSHGAAERALGFPLARRGAWNGRGKPAKRRLAGSAPRRLGIALGRVLAHELTHTIAPDCPHTKSGLMAKRLNRRMLTAPGVRFDALATRHLQQRVASLGGSAPESG